LGSSSTSVALTKYILREELGDSGPFKAIVSDTNLKRAPKAAMYALQQPVLEHATNYRKLVECANSGVMQISLQSARRWCVSASLNAASTKQVALEEEIQKGLWCENYHFASSMAHDAAIIIASHINCVTTLSGIAHQVDLHCGWSWLTPDKAFALSGCSHKRATLVPELTLDVGSGRMSVASD